MKKVLSALAALAMTAAVLTGCAKNSPQTSAPAQESTTAVQTSKEQETAAATEKAENAEAPSDTYTLKIGSLKGPTSMGLVQLMDKAKKGETQNSYEFTMVTAPDELLGKIVSGELDVALIPANLASILYTKTNHNITVLDINTLGVLYAVSADDSIHTTADLKGKTIYLTGKGATPGLYATYGWVR